MKHTYISATWDEDYSWPPCQDLALIILDRGQQSLGTGSKKPSGLSTSFTNEAGQIQADDVISSSLTSERLDRG